MTNHLFSKQDVIELLSLIRNIRTEYPSDLLAARRRIYLGLAAQLAATQNTIPSKRSQWLSLILQEPASTITKILIVVFAVFLIAFMAHAIATGSLDFGWLMELLSR
jgi:hypothetical protein